MTSLAHHALLDELNPAQRQVVEHVEGALLIEANPSLRPSAIRHSFSVATVSEPRRTMPR